MSQHQQTHTQTTYLCVSFRSVLRQFTYDIIIIIIVNRNLQTRLYKSSVTCALYRRSTQMQNTYPIKTVRIVFEQVSHNYTAYGIEDNVVRVARQIPW